MLPGGVVPARGSLPPNTTVVYLLAEADAAPPALDTAACFAGREAHCVLAAADGGNGLPATLAAAERVISLPMHSDLDEATQDLIVGAVRAFAG